MNPSKLHADVTQAITDLREFHEKLSIGEANIGDINALATVARNLLVDCAELHRMHCDHPPQECGEVGNMLAWLAHCMGATAKDTAVFPTRLFWYDSECKERGGCGVHFRLKGDE